MTSYPYRTYAKIDLNKLQHMFAVPTTASGRSIAPSTRSKKLHWTN